MKDRNITFNNDIICSGIDHAAWLETTSHGEHERLGPPPETYFLLRATHTSPYVRKVRIAADILCLSNKILMSPAKLNLEDTELINSSPISRIPVLHTSDGQSHFESNIIIEYLCSLSPELGASIIPKDTSAYFENKRLEAVADTITGAVLTTMLEKMYHDESAVSAHITTRQAGKIERGLEYLNKHIHSQRLTHSACIAAACALGYLDWRGPDWRQPYPDLIHWLEKFCAEVPAYEATKAL